jgi:hypothetical protein
MPCIEVGWMPVVCHCPVESVCGFVQLAEVWRLVVKCMRYATYTGMPTVLTRDDQFMGWMTCLHTAITRPLPMVSGACMHAVMCVMKVRFVCTAITWPLPMVSGACMHAVMCVMEVREFLLPSHGAWCVHARSHVCNEGQGYTCANIREPRAR